MSKKLKELVKQRSPELLFITLVTLVILLNLSKDSVIAGLDNISPWFGYDYLLYRALNSNTFFEFGPLLFNPLIKIVNIFNLPAWLGSQIVVWMGFALGTYFLFESIRYVLKRDFDTVETVLLFFLSVGSLISIWIFNQPILIFVSMYGGFPAVLFLLLQKGKVKEIGWAKLVAALLGVSYFLTTSINLVAFISGLVLLVIVAVEFKSAFFDQKRDVISRSVFRRAAVLFLFWILLVQVFLLFTPEKRFIAGEVLNQYSSLSTSPLTEHITEDLRASEYRNNTFLNSIRFATGWMELHDINNEPVFQYYDRYMSSAFFILIGLMPFGVILATSRKVIKENRKMSYLLVLYLGSIFLISRYFAEITSLLPIVEDATRWLSSKIWQIPFVLLPLMVILGIRQIDMRYRRYLQLGLVACLFIYSFPWWTGDILSRYSKVEIPQEYSYFSKFNEEDKVLYSPAPQLLYFRQYDWGYYGSDFLSYMSKAEFVDVSSVSEYVEVYGDLLLAAHRCDVDALKKEEIDYFVTDHTLVDRDPIIPEIGCTELNPFESNKYFTVWEVR